MAVYSFKIESVCAGGEHITLGLYRDAVKVGTKPLTKTEAMASDADFSDVAIYLIRKAINEHNATTPLQRKAAIEGIQVTL